MHKGDTILFILFISKLSFNVLMKYVSWSRRRMGKIVGGGALLFFSLPNIIRGIE
jgi:hypothetical protein